ncbi:MAG: hypothetical protein NTY47_01500 [Candidatus Omnitrophica bacterium]|nr:hypothetical protein [Candidatus Omnitrophota bacterium]
MNKKQIIEKIDKVISDYKEAHLKSKYMDLSDLHNNALVESLEVRTLNIIESVTDGKSPFRKKAYYADGKNVSIDRLIGILEALKGEIIQSGNKFIEESSANDDKKSGYKLIVEELKKFRELVKYYSDNVYNDYGPDLSETRQQINTRIPKIKADLKKANVQTQMSYRAPAAIGGYPYTLDLIDDMFQNERGPFAVNLSNTLDTLGRAIGIYEELMVSGKSLKDSSEELLFRNWIPFASNKIVFLAHRFEEKDLINQIKDKLTKKGFEFKEGKVEDLGYISEDIINKIMSSGFFLALVTPYKEFKDGKSSTSAWILMEIGAAIAYERRVLMLAENCVEQDEYSRKLQSECQYEIFDREKDFGVKVDVAINRMEKEWDKRNNPG